MCNEQPAVSKLRACFRLLAQNLKSTDVVTHVGVHTSKPAGLITVFKQGPHCTAVVHVCSNCSTFEPTWVQNLSESMLVAGIGHISPLLQRAGKLFIAWRAALLLMLESIFQHARMHLSSNVH